MTKIILSIVAAIAVFTCSTNAAIVLTNTQATAANPPTISTVDLGQTAFLSSSGTGTGDQSGEHATLFNGLIGNTDGDANDNAEVTLNNSSSITLNLDTSVNTLGYDITQIDTLFGWNPGAGGRSNQGYEVIIGFVDGSPDATLIPSAHHQPNNPSSYWTLVSFTDDTDPFLGNIATGVNSITWNIDNNANPGGNVIAREFDVFGTATIPEPSTFLLTVFAGLALFCGRRRR